MPNSGELESKSCYCLELTFLHRSLRQMAAIVLRRNFASVWQAAAPPSQASFKLMVTEALSREQHDQVASAIAKLASQVCSRTLKNDCSFAGIEEHFTGSYFYSSPARWLA